MSTGIKDSKGSQNSVYLKRINKLITLLKQCEVDAYIVPTTDEFQNEFVPENKQRLKWLSGFSGSNGVLLLRSNKMVLYTDGRYLLQAKQELKKFIDEGFAEIVDMYDKKSCNILDHFIKSGEKIGYDPMLHTLANINYYERFAQKNNFTMVALKENLVDKIKKHDDTQNSINNINNKKHDEIPIFLDISATGRSTEDKITDITEIVLKKSTENNLQQPDFLFVNSLECACWLLNVRGFDVPTSMLLYSYVLINIKSKKIILFVEEDKIQHFKKNEEKTQYNHAKIIDSVNTIGEIDKYVSELLEQQKKIQMDGRTTPIHFFELAKNYKNLVINDNDPIFELKACKNSTELSMMQKAHIDDAVAWMHFLTWINENAENLNEIAAADQLLYFQKRLPTFVTQSFSTISGFASNGAVIHYNPMSKANSVKSTRLSKSAKDPIYLCDAGGQYRYGTTDITRTISIGQKNIKQEHKKHYTLVLKGHIDLASAIFPKDKTTGKQLDVLARQYLWHEGLDYQHGTGHGVGHFLNVHEGPQAISSRNDVILKEGMIVSIEPGFYKEGRYGIRLENLYYIRECKKAQGFLEFEALTLVPFDESLILFDELTKHQKQWLINYNIKIDKVVRKLISNGSVER